MKLKDQCRPTGEGYYTLDTSPGAPVRLFLNEKLFAESEEGLYAQVRAAAEYPGVLDVVITPDAHVGNTVPVGCVIATDGTLLQAPVGYDIGCFVGDTLVPTVDGASHTLRALADRGGEHLVFAITSEQKVVVAKATARRTRIAAPLVRVTLDNGREIVCTPDHEFLLRDGTYRTASALSPQTSLMPFYGGRDRDGYALALHPATGRSQRVHWMMARGGFLGDIPKFPEQKTVIHHRNFNPADNRPENLQFMGDRDHQRYHRANVEKHTHWQSEEFERKRKAALAAKAATPEGRAFMAERGTKNLRAYMEGHPEHFQQAVAGNGEQGKQFLVAYNRSEKGRARSSEIGNRIYTCEVCGAKVRSGLGLSSHRRWKHGYNHKVVSVEPLGVTADVYCLSVPGYGNFALDAGVFVHNCGIMSFRSDVPHTKGLDEKLRRKFSEEVMKRIGLGLGQRGVFSFTHREFQEIIRQGATALGYARTSSERDFIPVDDDWEPPQKAVDRGIGQLGSLGSGNHFCELQHDENGRLWVMVHTGSRGFGYQLATHYLEAGREEQRKRGVSGRRVEAGAYFEPDSPHWRGYKNAVAAGGNFAIANRLLLWQQVGTAFRRVFGQEPELVYEISHNLAQEEVLPDGRAAWVHRKGATRAFPAGHPMLAGTPWEATGHPVLIPGSMGDTSYVLTPKAGAAKSLFSVNHGCGRRMSRGEARQRLTQSGVNKQMKRLNVLVNAGGDVPIDESPDVYKPAKDVIAAVVDAGLAEVTTTLTPIASIKGVD